MDEFRQALFQPTATSAAELGTNASDHFSLLPAQQHFYGRHATCVSAAETGVGGLRYHHEIVASM